MQNPPMTRQLSALESRNGVLRYLVVAGGRQSLQERRGWPQGWKLHWMKRNGRAPCGVCWAAGISADSVLAPEPAPAGVPPP
jgi:hypothetical protein